MRSDDATQTGDRMPPLIRRPRRTLLVALLVTIILGVTASRLRLETDIVALMPEGTAAANDYRTFLQVFGGFEKVFVVVVADEPETVESGTLLEAAQWLEERLSESNEIASVRSGLEPEDEEFFLHYVVRRSLLLAPSAALDDLETRLAPERVADRAAELRSQLSTPSGGLAVQLATHDPFGFATDLSVMKAVEGGIPMDPLTGAFLSDTGDSALLVLTPSSREIDPLSGQRLQAELDEAQSDLSAEIPGVRFLAVGGPLYAAQDEAVIRRDVESTITGSLVVCVIILLLAFGGPWIPIATLLTLIAALVATTAALALLLGSVTAAGLGFAAVLVGLGIDYGIHGGTRYRQCRLLGEPPGRALAGAWRDAGPGITTSAITTAAAFATLGAAHFRPLRELGVVVAVGIAMILISTMTVGAALLAVRPAVRPPGWLWRGLETLVERVTETSWRNAPVTLLICALTTLAALWGVSRLEVEASLQALRPANHPAAEAERRLMAGFGVSVDTATLLVPAPDIDSALERVSAASDILLSHQPDVVILSALDYLLPQPAADHRLARLAASRLAAATDDLEAALVANNLSPRAFQPGLSAARAMAAGRDPGAPDAAIWPEAVDEVLRTGAVDPTGGDQPVWAAMRLRLPEEVWTDGPPAEVIEEILGVAPGLAVASVPRLGETMKQLALNDLRRLALIALALVLLVVSVSFRGDWRASLLAAVPVVLGTLWALGLWGALGRNLDLLSLSVVPILLGIGIDDGLHAVHGSRHAAMKTAVASAGLAMSLTTLTTCVGFGSLAFSSIPGLANGGVLVAVGVLACLLATLTVLPALGRYGKNDLT